MIEFWYEFSSSYSYPAAWRIERTAGQKRLKVLWRPFLLGPLLLRQQGLSDSPFNLVEAKGRHMWRDVERICEAESLPFRRPRVFPRRTLLAARLALAGAAEGWTAPFSRSVFEAYFGEDRDISDPAVLAPLVEAAGGDSRAAFVAAGSETIKTALRTNGEEAEARGLFGSPSFICASVPGGSGELFWGNDRLDQAVAYAARSAGD